MKPKLCYILPSFSTGAHFSYNVKFADAIKDKFDLFFVLEKGLRFSLPGTYTYVQRHNFLPIRYIENFILLARARRLGYKDFYVHYSFLSALNASIITTLFGGRVYYWNSGLPWDYPQNFLRRFFERIIYRSIDFLVTGTEDLARQYEKHYGILRTNIKVMPNWIAVDGFADVIDFFRKQKNIIKNQLLVSPDKKIVLFVHRLSNRKGAQYLPAIAEALSDEEAILVIVGDGPGRKKIEIELIAKGLMPGVRMIGLIGQEEIPKYFAIADVFIMPSDEEGFPHVLLETMAASVPFVAFRVGGVNELLTPELRQYALDSRNINTFIHTVRTLLHMDQTTRNFIIKHESNCVLRYDISNVINIFEKLFV